MSEIKDGVYAQVSGSVSRIFSYQGGVAATLEVKGEKQQYPDRVTVWGIDALDLNQGDRVQLKGWLSWKPDEYSKKNGEIGHGVSVSLNKPELLKHERAQSQPPATPANNGWGAPADAWAPSNDGAPF